MTTLSRRSVCAGAALFVASPARPDLFDGQTITIGEREFVLTDIPAPSPAALGGGAEPGAAASAEVLRGLLASGSVAFNTETARDRWGRASGPARLRLPDGAGTTVQEVFLPAGAARVHPQSADDALLDLYFAAEDEARAASLGLWSRPHYAIRSADDERMTYGIQLYQGAIRKAADSYGRVYFNFGEDFRSDLTATLTRGAFRRWKPAVELESYVGRSVEVRGFVDKINGPSIELRHERQLRFL